MASDSLHAIECPLRQIQLKSESNVVSNTTIVDIHILRRRWAKRSHIQNRFGMVVPNTTTTTSTTHIHIWYSVRDTGDRRAHHGWRFLVDWVHIFTINAYVFIHFQRIGKFYRFPRSLSLSFSLDIEHTRSMVSDFITRKVQSELEELNFSQYNNKIILYWYQIRIVFLVCEFFFSATHNNCFVLIFNFWSDRHIYSAR